MQGGEPSKKKGHGRSRKLTKVRESHMKKIKKKIASLRDSNANQYDYSNPGHRRDHDSIAFLKIPRW